MKFLTVILAGFTANTAMAEVPNAINCRIFEKIGSHQSQISDVPIEMDGHANFNLILYPKISLAISYASDNKGGLISVVATDLDIPNAKTPQGARLFSVSTYTYLDSLFKVGESKDHSVALGCFGKDN